jgi:hypothetical protein
MHRLLLGGLLLALAVTLVGCGPEPSPVIAATTRGRLMQPGKGADKQPVKSTEPKKAP